jgi:hypothetical protein
MQGIGSEKIDGPPAAGGGAAPADGKVALPRRPVAALRWPPATDAQPSGLKDTLTLSPAG